MDQPIAVIGLSCRLPGGANDPESFWNLCAEAKDVWSPVPIERYNQAAFYHPENTRTGASNVKGGYFLQTSLAHFDAPFFGFGKAEAEALDPQQRLLLECSYEAIENAGIPLSKIKGSSTGVFASTFATDWNEILLRDPDSIPRYHCTGTGHCMLSNRLSYFLDVKGPCVTVDTACSGSLVATHLACQALRTGECEQVLVGGSNVVINPDKTSSLSMLKFLSPDGRSYAFDHRANGYARGEGACCLILKPLEKALECGDPIRAVIRKTGVNQDGRTLGITMPNGEAQAKLIGDLYTAASLDPLETDYVEAHGTGTATGDPIEAKALSQVFCRNRTKDRPLMIGSVKSNIGHLEGASGLASLVKVVLMLERKQFLPNVNFEKPNPDIPFFEWKLTVSRKLQAWNSSNTRRASINSFGYGGTNAHVIIDEAQDYIPERRDSGYAVNGTDHSERSLSSTSESGPCMPKQDRAVPLLFVLSGHSQESTKVIASNLASYLLSYQDNVPAGFLKDLAYTLATRRTLLSNRCAVAANSVMGLIEELQSQKDTITSSTQVPELAFVFTGQGAQWYAMGRELFDSQLVFRETMDRAELYFKQLGASWSLRDELLQDEERSRLAEAYLSQPICTAIQIALVDLLSSWDVQPKAVTGHSSGEIAAAYAVGGLSFCDALKIAYFRGRCIADAVDSGTLEHGSMMAVGLPADEGEQLVSNTTKGKAVVACFNSPASLTLSGDDDAINEIQNLLNGQGVFARKLLVQTAYHSHHMQVIASPYRTKIADVKARPSQSTTYYSSVEGKILDTVELGPEYWVKNLLSPVKFVEAFQALCSSVSHGSRTKSASSSKELVCVELGPHSALSGPIKQSFQEGGFPKALKLRYLPTLVRGSNASDTLFALGGSLFESGYPVNISSLNQSEGGTKKVLTGLPPYPWNRSAAYWAETSRSKAYSTRSQPRHDLLGAPVLSSNSLEPQWRNILRSLELPWLRDHRVQGAIAYPFAGFIAMAVEAASQKAKSTGNNAVGFKLREVSIQQALVIGEGSDYNEVTFSMRPYPEGSRGSSGTWDEFRIFSTSQTGTAEHCRGLIGIIDTVSDESEALMREGTRVLELAKFGDIAAECTEFVDLDKLYASLSEIGIDYGPTFANLTEARVGHEQCIARLTVPDTASVMPQNFEHPFIIHPGTLDSTLHAFLAIFTSQTSRMSGAVVPTFLKDMYIDGAVKKKPGEHLTVLATIKPEPGREALGSLVAFDPDDPERTVQIRMSGLTLTSLGHNISQKAEESQKQTAFRTIWKRDANLLSSGQKMNLLASPGSTEREKKTALAMEKAAFFFAQRALAQFNSADSTKIKDYHRKHINFLSKLCDDVRSGADESKIWLEVSEEDREALFKFVEDSGDEGRLFVHVGKRLSSIILGDAEALSVMIEGDRLEKYYRNMASTKLLSESAARYVNLMGHQNPSMRILEIGAGTGGTSFPILEQLGGRDKLTPQFSLYDYTDISSGFFEKPRKRAQRWGNLVQFKKLDIEEDPGAQGFEAGSYDLVVAANVLHATKLMKKTLSHVRQLLKPGGQLLLIELTAAKSGTSLIFGTLPGWWLAQEPYREQGPLMTEKQWDSLLHETGFTGAELSVWDTPSLQVHQASMILSRVPAEVPIVPQKVTIVINETHVGALERYLEKLLQSAHIDCKIEKAADADCQNRVCIFIAEIRKPVLSSLDKNSYEDVQRLLSTSSGALWVKRSGKDKAAWGMAEGLIRTLRTEATDATLMTLDLEDIGTLNERQAAEHIFTVFKHGFVSQSSRETVEVEYREMNGELYIPRIAKDVSTSKFIATRTNHSVPEDQPFYQPGRSLTLAMGSPGLLNSIHFIDDPKRDLELSSDQIEIEVMAVGINFRDVMQALGQIKFRALGAECSGIVSRTGLCVRHLETGDRVIAFVNDAFANRVRAEAVHAHKLPDDVSFDVGAAMPLVYWTALHSTKIAHIAKGETVLIHAAMGGLGQALVTLCQHIGAEVFATVGTAKKRDLLKENYGIPDDHIFNSRNGTFAKDIMRQTAGRGMDVVMNCVAGDLLRQTWECMAEFGRFIELGVKDIMVNTRLEMAPFIRNLTYAAVNMLSVIEKRPEYISELWTEVITLLQEGKIKPPQPITEFPMRDVEKALRTMQSGNNVGKMVVVPQKGDVVKAVPPGTSKELFHQKATYVLVGGLGGLGRAIALWMVEHGAKFIAFLSRSGSAHLEAESTTKALEKQGAVCLVLKCDVTSSESLSSALSRLASETAPIRGVMQLAMVMKNATFQEMSFQDWQDSVQPKVRGTWNLHESLLETPLDFFINFSSLVGVIGNAGQAAYGAASSFLDEFAAYRHNLGLPVTTIDLGPVLEIGYVAENQRVLHNLQRQGLGVVREKELIALLEYSILRQEPHREGDSIILGLGDWTPSNPLAVYRTPKFSHFRRLGLSTSTQLTEEGEQKQTTKVELRSASTSEQAREVILKAMSAKASNLLMMPVDNVDESKTLSAQGIDSLVAVEMRNWLASDIGCSMSVLELMANQPLSELCAQILQKLKLRFAE